MSAGSIPRQVCLPVLAGTPVSDLSWRVALVLGRRMVGAGDKVTICVCHPRFPWGREEPPIELIEHLAHPSGIEVMRLPDRFPMEGDVGFELSGRLDAWLRTEPFNAIYLPDHLGIGYFAQLSRKLGRAHLHTSFHLYLLGPTRALMWERAMYPGLAELSTFHREAESIAMADEVTLLSECQRAALPEGIEASLHGDCLEDPETGWPSLLEQVSGLLADGPERIVCLTYRAQADEIELFARALRRALTKRTSERPLEVCCVQWGSAHAPAQLAALRKYLHDQPVTLRFANFDLGGIDEGEAVACLRAAAFTVVPAFGIDAAHLVRLGRSLELSLLAQDHPAVLDMISGQAREEVLFNNDWKVLGDRILGAFGQPPAPLKLASSGPIEHTAANVSIPAPAPISGDPLVSVVLTLYDRWHLLPTALESLARQSWGRIEILISDDGSDDPGAIAFLERMDSETRYGRLKVVRQPHHSLGRNRNTAVGQAEGDYILFMDDDNIAKPHEVEAFLSAMQHSGADALSCFCDLFAEEETALGNHLPLSRRLFLGGAIAPSVASNTLGDANSFFRRDVFERFGKLVERPQLGFEDWEILARIALEGGYVSVVPEALYWYREAPGAMTATTRQLANNLVPLGTYLTHAGPFADLLWHVKGDHLQRAAGAKEQIV